MVKLAFENNVKNHEVVLRGEDEHLRLFFISDIHARKINKKMIEQIERPINAVIIGGDLADSRTPIRRIRSNIQRLKKLAPIYFVWGNNDREVGEVQLKNLLLEQNVTILENNAFPLTNVKNRCMFVAIDDVTTGNPNIEKAFEKCRKEHNVFFISHNPYIFRKVMDEYKPQLLMGGHYHGGQIRLGPFGIFPKGSFQKINDCYTLISNGYGTTALPLRFGAKAECHIIDITFRSKTNPTSYIESL